MFRPHRRRARGLALGLCLMGVVPPLVAQAQSAPPSAQPRVGSDWPTLPATPLDPDQERRIAAMVGRMSLRQKVGQMIQTEIKAASPEDLRTWYLGSVLNGGGSWPGGRQDASLTSWVRLADAYYDAAMASDAPDPVPPLWGVDAVHGHNNVQGATLFPHNIGLGAARDPELVGEIGRAVGRAVRATGINWVFAPTVAVVQDQRWGRTYEGFGADPALVRTYAGAYVRGLQGDLKGDGTVIATVKHFFGDGGTETGRNEGVTLAPARQMFDLHAQGYLGGLAAGAQTVMASFSSWSDPAAGIDYGKMHGSRVLLTDFLKTRLNFQGLVISDWDGIGQVPGCTRSHCPQAINAGVDMLMVSTEWKPLIENTVKDVETGAVPMARIDDAVTRILRVKMRAGLFGRRPSASRYAGKPAAIEARGLARRAVRESLVLLKNDGAVLPLRPGRRVLVVGKSADSLPDQVGGWSITWQGDHTTNADFPRAVSVLSALRRANRGGKVTYAPTGEGVRVEDFDVVVAVIGERPYAETAGDVASLSHTARYPEDLKVLEAVAGHGRPVVTLFESGRTVYVNDLLNRSDAFVALWLPGSEGQGVTDLLFRDARHPRFDFRGVTPFDWLATACPAPGAPVLFRAGFGLTYKHPAAPLGPLGEAAPVQSCPDVRR